MTYRIGGPDRVDEVPKGRSECLGGRPSYWWLSPSSSALIMHKAMQRF
jgi:hypothetical protein